MMATARKAKASTELQLWSHKFTPHEKEALDEAPQEVEL
jgi:hypothetical protein